jgi:hypothetical protein
MMSDNWELIEPGVYNLWKSKDGNYLCQEFNEAEYGLLLTRACWIRDLNFIDSPDLKHYKWLAPFAKDERFGWKIYIRFTGHLVQDILDRGEKLEEYCPDWKEQLEQMCVDLHKEGIYKLSMYPKCFFIDEDKVLKTFSFFSASRYIEQPINMQLYMPLLNSDRASLVRKLMVGDKLDMGLLNEKAFKEYIKWPGDPLPEIYQKVYLADNYQ